MPPDPARRFLFFLLSDANKASSRVRGHWVADELRSRGHAVTIRSGASYFDYARAVTLLLVHDVLVLQKRCGRFDFYLVSLARWLGLTVIFDVDDYPSPSGKLSTLRNVGRIVRRVHLVTAGCDALRRLVEEEGGHGELHPTCIRLAGYSVQASKPISDRVCLGWVGNGRHYADDLCDLVYPALRRLATDHPFRLRLVGVAGSAKIHDVFTRLRGAQVELIDEIQWSSPKAVADAVGCFDVGLYPLRNTSFNWYKCGFKAIEYMALGIPVVANPVGSITQIVRDGVDGYLAEGENAWLSALMRLCESPDLRSEMGASGRRRVEAEFSIESAADRMERAVASVSGS